MAFIVKAIQDAGVFAYDASLTLKNSFAAPRPIGKVTPEGHPGFDGKWPAFVPPKEGDSRCSCPALNAMANHGIFPHDGKGITFKELNEKVNTTYNFAPSFCFFVPDFAARMLGRNYNTDKFDLKDLDLHSDKSIEHDASLIRRDAHFQPDQSVIHIPFIKELLESASGKDEDGNPLLTPADVSLISSKRRAESRAENPNFMLTKGHKFFGSSNASTLLLILGGRIKDIEIFLTEERIPDGWESRIRAPNGLTILTFNNTVKQVENGIDESKFAPAPTEDAPKDAAPAAST